MTHTNSSRRSATRSLLVILAIIYIFFSPVKGSSIMDDIDYVGNIAAMLFGVAVVGLMLFLVSYRRNK